MAKVQIKSENSENFENSEICGVFFVTLASKGEEVAAGDCSLAQKPRMAM